MGKREDIKKYISLCILTEDVKKSFVKNLVKTFYHNNNKAEKIDKIMEASWKEITDAANLEKFVDLFDKEFTHDEILYYLKFYTSEECKKNEVKGKNIISEIFNDARKVIEKEMCNSYQEECKIGSGA